MTTLGLAGAGYGLVAHLAAPPHVGPPSDHFDGERFENVPPMPPRNVAGITRWLTEAREPWPEWVAAPAGPAPPRRVTGGIRVTFVNHATLLLQLGGLNVLTDPIWSERASPLGWLGPRRHRAPGLTLEALPPIDAVLISHNHYDHLDVPTLARLIARDHPRVLAGLGTARLLARAGLDPRQVTDLDWWQAQALGPVTITLTPAQHWSARSLTDRRRTLWGSFHLRAGPTSAYFAGDTGLGPHFATIRSRLGAPDLALLPIGAYAPRWLMRPQHLDPTEAVTAHRALGARQAVAMHWGTFQLSHEGLDAPPRALAAAARAAGLAPHAFRVLQPGEALEVPGP
ncbi:MAG: MBL fold metallo-hydrolase [Candidatus Sericytochromatia bacterium]|nr:MBL fold metallo-hydrolase [Candidatus Sericytochromatia bacterium]